MKIIMVIFMLVISGNLIGCIGFHHSNDQPNIETSSLNSIKEILFSIEVEGTTNSGKIFLPKELSLNKILDSYNDCSESRSIAYEQRLNLSEDQIGLLDLACHFFQNIMADDRVKWRLIQKEEKKEGDIYIQIKLTRNSFPSTWRNVWMFSSIFTLFLIPYWSTQEIQLSALVYRGVTKTPLRWYELNDGWTSVAQTALVIAYPFATSSRKAYSQTVESISKSFIGILTKDRIID